MKGALAILQKEVHELTKKVASLEADKDEQIQKVFKAIFQKVLSQKVNEKK